MAYQIFIQALAILWLLPFALSYHAKSRKQILIIQIVGLLILGTHYLLLQAMSGAAMIFIHVLMLVIFLFKEKYSFLENKLILYAFLLIYFVFTLLTWQGYLSLLAFFGVGIGALAKWQSKPQTIRFYSIPSSVSWIIYDILVNSFGGLISEMVILASVFISLIMKRKVIDKL